MTKDKTQQVIPIFQHPRLGLGCMGMSWGYNESTKDDNESIKTIHAAIEKGIQMIDTAVIYGNGHNESLVGKALAGQRDKAYIASKGGLVVDHLPTKKMHNDGSSQMLNRQVNESLKRLQTDHIDLYYLHRVDPNVDIRTSVEALSQRVNKGDIGAIGLSEVSAQQATIASEIHPIAAIQSELSLWTRNALEAKNKEQPSILEWTTHNEALFIPFAPLGRGFLTGTIQSNSDLENGDFRKTNPRFKTDALTHNLTILEAIKEIAETHSATLAQVALAWVKAQGENIVPIPGSRKVSHLIENIESDNLILTGKELQKLNSVKPALGTRY